VSRERLSSELEVRNRGRDPDGGDTVAGGGEIMEYCVTVQYIGSSTLGRRRHRFSVAIRPELA